MQRGFLKALDCSINPLERGGLALLDRSCRRFLLAQQLARQALLADDRVGVGRLRAACANIGKPVFGPPQAEIRGLLARLAGTRLLHDLPRLLACALLLRSARAGLWRAQLEI